jgi:hypothetical protein
MTTKYSITQARQAIEHVTAAYADEGTVVEAAREGARILAWLERRAELVKAVDALERQRPDLVDLFREFPGAEIADVRAMYPQFNNGAGIE